jgi:hypothetical protein
MKHSAILKLHLSDHESENNFTREFTFDLKDKDITSFVVSNHSKIVKTEIFLTEKGK